MHSESSLAETGLVANAKGQINKPSNWFRQWLGTKQAASHYLNQIQLTMTLFTEAYMRQLASIIQSEDYMNSMVM